MITLSPTLPAGVSGTGNPLALPSGQPGAPTRLPALAPGQVLVVTVRGPGAPGTVGLEIAGTTVQARSTMTLEPGARLAVQVERTTPVPVLRVLDQAGLAEVVKNRGLREALPRQAPLASTLESLATAVRAPATASGSVQTGAAARAAAQVQAALPSAAGLADAGGVARAIRNSGVFLEAKLAALADGRLPPSALAGDLKAALGRVITALESPGATRRAAGAAAPTPAAAVTGSARGPATPAPVTAAAGVGAVTGSARGPATPAPAEAVAVPRDGPAGGARAASADSDLRLAAQRGPALPADPRALAESALMRVQANQLASVPAGEATGNAWHVEIPVRDGERIAGLEVAIERDARAPGEAGEEDRVWRVRLRATLEAIGVLEAHLSLNGDTIHAGLWVEHEGAARMLDAHLSELGRALAGAGLQVGELHCQAGSAPRPEPAHDPGTLIAVHA